MSRNKAKLITEYLMATKNEIAIDESLYALSGLQPAELGHAPRPSKLIGLARYKVFIRASAALFRLFWRNGGASLFFFYEWLRLRRYVGKPVDPASLRAETFGLAYSRRAVELLTAEMAGRQFCWLALPWLPVHSEHPVINVFDLLDRNDLQKAYGLANTASHKLSHSRVAAKWGLQSYTAFRWFCVRLALDKLPPAKLLMGEHYDRWASLTDGVVGSKRNLPGGANGIVLVQHGILASLAHEEGGHAQLPFEITARLRNVTKLYAFDQKSSDIFRRCVFSSLSRLDLSDIQFYQPRLTLSVMSDAKAVNVLFVGHPLCEALHLQLVKVLLKEYELGVYYKPHPANPASGEVLSGAWTVIKEKGIFPTVDILISYPSTLVQEYEGMAIPAIIHPLNMQPSLANSLMDPIMLRLDALGCKHRGSRENERVKYRGNNE